MTARIIRNRQEYREVRQTLLDLVQHDPALGTPEDGQLLAGGEAGLER